jgi:hypothetical protein
MEKNNNSEHNIGPFGYLPFGRLEWGAFLLHIRPSAGSMISQRIPKIILTA